jgi:predicted amidohydrolase YtcJ
MKKRHSRDKGISRRDLIKSVASGAVLATGVASTAGAHDGTEPERWSPESDEGDLALVNGHILTLDDRNTVASSVAIRDGRIVEVGSRVRSCARTIDLRGATVIPGLVDGTARYLRTAEEPGYQVRVIETATSIADLQQLISNRAKTVPVGAFLTCVGGWNQYNFTERRLPTVRELDAAAPRHPVFLSFSPYDDSPGAVTNSRGKAFFEAHGVRVSSAGLLGSTSALAALNAGRPDSDRVRSTAGALDFALSVGVTTILELGEINLADRLESQYQWALELWRQGKLHVRLRLRLGNGIDDAVSSMRVRILNNFNRFGDDRLRLNGIGDAIWGNNPAGPNWPEECTFVAENEWNLSLEALDLPTATQFVAAMQVANRAHSIADLRWSLCNVGTLTPRLLDALGEMGAGVLGGIWQYLNSGSATAGPPWKMLIDSGLPIGVGTDATWSGPFNPWIGIYHMTTGRDNAGVLANPGQTISRLQALKTYTRGSAWHSGDDDQLGTIETGKFADLAVLSANPLEVPDAKLRRITSTLTLHAGKIVHKAPPA